MAVQAGDDPSNRGGEKSQARQHARTVKSYAAGALVQAALNAMAVSAPCSEPSAASGDFLAPAAPVAAVIAVQVRSKVAFWSMAWHALLVHVASCAQDNESDQMLRKLHRL